MERPRQRASNVAAYRMITKEAIIERVREIPFSPNAALKNAHAQTIAGALYKRRTRLLTRNSEPRFFDPAPGVRVLAHCSWQDDRRRRPTVPILHGLEGSTGSRYIHGTAA